MQPWQCIALIVLSIAVFFYASFLDEIDETAKSSLVTLAEQTQSSGNNSKESDLNASSAWAEVFLVLESAITEEYALSFHEESLDSKIFLTRLFDELKKKIGRAHV